MQKTSLFVPFALASIAVLTGCASEPKFAVDSYTYESKQHDGSVAVTDVTDRDTEHCSPHWRDNDQLPAAGIKNLIGTLTHVKIFVREKGAGEKLLDIDVPAGFDHKIVKKDYQVDKNLILQPESNGLVKQGDLFGYPEGYYLRASRPVAEDDYLGVCLAIDRMYIPVGGMTEGQPQLRLDRLNVFFSAEDGESAEYTLGTGANAVDVTVEASVDPR